MKLISLNIWAGRVFKPLLKYISDHAHDTDIFCFQEVFDTPTSRKVVSKLYRANIFSELQKVLPNHTGYFAPAQDGFGMKGQVINFQISWGLALFVRKSLTVNEVGEIYIRGHRNSRGKDATTMPRNLQYATITANKIDYTVANFHGLWNGRGKTDTDERLEQSRKVKKFLDTMSGKRILCGDFNLSPDTKSLGILEKGLVNLIKENGIFSTRSSLYTKQNKFADYMLVSPEVVVEKFNVPNIEISDHLPMELSFH